MDRNAADRSGTLAPAVSSLWLRSSSSATISVVEILELVSQLQLPQADKWAERPVHGTGWRV